MRNAGETVRVASACELSADMPPTPQRTISISRAQGFSCVSCRVRFARAPLFFWLFLHLSTSSSWTRSRRTHSSSRCRIFGSSTDDWPARGQTGLGLGLACPPPFLLTGLFSSRSKSRSSRATYSPVCPTSTHVQIPHAMIGSRYSGVPPKALSAPHDRRASLSALLDAVEPRWTLQSLSK